MKAFPGSPLEVIKTEFLFLGSLDKPALVLGAGAGQAQKPSLKYAA